MADFHEPIPGGPRHRPAKEYEDNHFHDEDEVAPPPDDTQPSAAGRPPARPARKLLPRPRRFHED